MSHLASSDTTPRLCCCRKLRLATLKPTTKTRETPLYHQQLSLVDGETILALQPNARHEVVSDCSPPPLVGGVGPKHLVWRAPSQRNPLETTLCAPPPKIVLRKGVPGNQGLLIPRTPASLLSQLQGSHVKLIIRNKVHHRHEVAQQNPPRLHRLHLWRKTFFYH